MKNAYYTSNERVSSEAMYFICSSSLIYCIISPIIENYLPLIVYLYQSITVLKNM